MSYWLVRLLCANIRTGDVYLVSYWVLLWVATAEYILGYMPVLPDPA